jgi:site-specific DNA recombinase
MAEAGYIRVSTEEQAKHGWNLEEDRRLILERYPDAVIFEDPGRQGDDPDRPGLLALLSRLAEFDVVIMRQQDRISRDPVIWGTCEAAFRKAGVRVETFTGTIDLDTPQGRFVADMMAAVGKLEKGQIGQRVLQQKTARAEAGKPPGGRRPYGYVYDDGALVVNEVEAEVVRRMSEMADAGTSQRRISQILNSEGICTARGGRWAPSTISRILRSPLYLGKLPRKAGTVDGQHDAIVEDDLWLRVNRTRAMPERRAGGRPMKTGHLLTRGHLRCGCCGSGMFPVASYNGRPEVYRCIGRRDNGPSFCSMPGVLRRDIDEALLGELTKRYFDLDGTRDRLRDRIANELPSAHEAVHVREQELAKAESRITRVVRGWQDEVISDEEYASQRAELELERDAAEAALDQARLQVEQIENTGATTDAEEALLSHLADLHRLVSGTVGEARDVEALRTVIRTLLEKVTLVQWSWEDLDEIEAASVPAGDGLYLIPKVREGVAEWTSDGPVIHRVPVPELLTSGKRLPPENDVTGGNAVSEKVALSTCRRT